MVGIHLMVRLHHPPCDVEGIMNHVVDCLSRYYETDGPADTPVDHEFVSADVQLDPDGELLPIEWYVELCTAVLRQSCCLTNKVEQRALESAQMNKGATTAHIEQSEDDPLAIESGANGPSLRITIEKDIDLTSIACKAYRNNPLFAKILSHPEVHPHFGICDQLIWPKTRWAATSYVSPDSHT